MRELSGLAQKHRFSSVQLVYPCLPIHMRYACSQAPRQSGETDKSHYSKSLKYLCVSTVNFTIRNELAQALVRTIQYLR